MMKKAYVRVFQSGDIKINIESAGRYAEYALKCGAAPVTPHFFCAVKYSDITKVLGGLCV